jgi:N-acetylmuramoyl-L-alanine amidase
MVRTGLVVWAFFLGTFFYLPAGATAQLDLQVVYPREDLTITATDSTFIFGNVTDERAEVRVNGYPVRMYPGGTWMTVVPVSPGRFIFDCVARLGEDSVRVLRTVYIPPYLTTSPRDSLTIDTSYVFPRYDLELQPGDILPVAVKGSPGVEVSFQLEGIDREFRMTEKPPWRQRYWGEEVFGQGRPPATPRVQGVYTGMYQLTDADTLSDAAVRFRFVHPLGDTAEVLAPGRVTLRRDAVPRVAEIIEDQVVGRSGRGLGYLIFLPYGVKVWVTGRDGDFYRVRLSDDESAWLPAQALRFLPEGTELPRSRVQVVRTRGMERRVEVRVVMFERLPYRIQQLRHPAGLVVTLYGGISDTDWIRFDNDPLIRDIRWSQSNQEVYKLYIDLNQSQQWGFNAYYDGTDLILEIRRTPPLAGWPSSPLKDLLVCVDPGHGPDLGAIGPSGLTEMDANLMLSRAIRRKLERKGARVILTRESAVGVPLRLRPRLAELVGADLLLSIHHNALPDGVNPWESRGSSTYFYHPQSRPLAEAIQRRLLERLKLPDFGLFYDNLALTRPTQMPAVLIEPAFIMHPEEELLIRSDQFRERTAEAIVQGLEDFLRQSKETKMP